jgi:hypothetical protein
MYFITQGLVEVFNNENDAIIKEKPILFLPKYAFFGEYQIMLNIKANCEFVTCQEPPVSVVAGRVGASLDTIFMCISNEKYNELCDLFP